MQQKTSDLSAMIAEIQRECYKGGVTGISGSGISGFEPELQLQELRTCVTNVKSRHGYVSPAQQKRNSAFDSLFRQELQEKWNIEKFIFNKVFGYAKVCKCK